MKSQILSTAALLVSLASANPIAIANTTPLLTKRADTPTGYGAATTGGAGGTAITVTSCAELTAAVAGTTAKIVTVSGMLDGCGIIDVGSNTSVL